MKNLFRTLLPASLLLLLAACHSVPQHVRFIPKDAMAVVGIHTGEMRKELAWSAITGSHLLDEMKGKGNEKAEDMLKDLDHSGIDFSSTIYGYTKQDNRFENELRMTAVFPVSDAKMLTTFIQKHTPGVHIQMIKDRNEAMVDGKIYLGWNNEVLIVMNPIVNKVERTIPAKPDTLAGSVFMADPYSWIEAVADSINTAAELDLVFNSTKANSISQDARFNTLENEGHDITMWLSYDAMAEKMSNKGGMDMMSIASAIWKSSAAAIGINFNKGSVDADMRYYSSDSMKSVAQEFGKVNVDAEMLKRLPVQGLNAALGYRISPTALKLMLDKMGLTGMANLTLMQNGTNIDELLGAFSGDMVGSVNNYSLQTKMQNIDSATLKEYGMTPYPITTPKMDFVYAIKIGDKAKMNKLMGFLTQSGLLAEIGPGQYAMANRSNGFTLIEGEKFLVVGSSPNIADGFIKSDASRASEVVRKQIEGHVTGLYVDVHSLLQASGALINLSNSDSSAFNVVRNLFSTFTMAGGEYKSNANCYKIALAFTNKEENSLVQLLHMAQQLSVINSSKKEVAIR